ncbi:hypothetical protein YC2023_010878 [Brassica napus]
MVRGESNGWETREGDNLSFCGEEMIIGRAMHGSDLPEQRNELARHLRFGATS